MKNVVLNDLFDYDNLKIYQYNDGFKFSLDSILLAEYVKITGKTNSILDLCTGNASIPLILSTKTNALIDAFEIQKDIFNLAIKSIKYNQKQKQITVYNADVKEINNYVNYKKYDIITCNPPYFKVKNNGYLNETEKLAIARHELKVTLDDIFKIASDHLNTKGEFYLVHRVNRLDEIIILGSKYKLNVKNIELIKTKENSSPYLVLIRAVKDSSLGVKINNPVCIQNLITYQNLFKEEL